jgi:hypothetical protein
VPANRKQEKRRLPMRSLTLKIGAYTAANAVSAVRDITDVILDEPLAVWLLEQDLFWTIQLNPRQSRRFPRTPGQNPIFTADLTWQLPDDIETALTLKFYPLPTPQTSIGVWQFA